MGSMDTILSPGAMPMVRLQNNTLEDVYKRQAQHGAQQAAQGGGLYVERTVFRQADEAANDLMGTIERFVVQLAVHVALPVFLLSERCGQAFEQGTDIDQ